MQRIHLFLAFLLSWTSISAQQYPFVHYTPREGLVNNRARSIVQDRKGKLYISTYGGFSVYDGTRFLNYTTQNGLITNLVNDIEEIGEDSSLIFPNANKVHLLVKGKLEDYPLKDSFCPVVNQLIRCSDGSLYAMADEGFYRLEGNRFKKIELPGLPGAEGAKSLIQGVEFDKKIFLITNPGYVSPYPGNVWVYDLVTRRVAAFKNNLKAIHLFNDKNNNLWVSGVDGLFLLDNIALDNGSIVLKPLPEFYNIPKDLIPNYIYRDRQDNIWLTSWRGVYKVDHAGRLTLFTVENGLAANEQTCIFQDSEDNMWFTNSQKGLSKLTNQQFEFYPLLSTGFSPTDLFVPRGSDSAWFFDGYHNRTILMLPNGQKKEFYYEKNQGELSGVFAANEREYILGSRGVMELKYIKGTNRYQLTRIPPDKGKVYFYRAAIFDLHDRLVAAADTLHVFTKNKKLSYPLEYFADQITLDRSGRIWLATRSNKIYCFEVKNDSLVLLKMFSRELPAVSPRSITADKDGNIWFGTRDHGLFCLYLNGLDFVRLEQLTTKNGLSDNFISFLYCDKVDAIWACTPSGLDKIRLNGNKSSIENVTSRNNIYHPISKIQQTRNGNFWILSPAGVIHYRPARQVNKDWKPMLSFAESVISNAKDLIFLPGQDLKYKQNNLLFRLSAPTFIDEKQTRFSYLLEGSGNEAWSEPSTNPSINLVNLPPGNYILHAKAIFLHGMYPDAQTSFSFTILPPWWTTTWFRLIVALFIVGFIVLAVRVYIHRKLEFQRIQMEKKQAIEKERTRIATDMHDDLGAGLSRIKFLSETIGMKKQKEQPIEEEIESIRNYSHDMIDKMGEIVWALNEKNDTLSDLLSYTRAYASEYLSQNGINCHVEEPDIIPQLFVSGEFRRNVYLTVKEALHNIVKHAQASEVFIIIDINDNLTIQIRDNGRGFDKKQVHSFGNGLINMDARIRSLKGSFDIHNDNGTVINMDIPLKV